MKSLRKVVSVVALSVMSLFCANAQVDLGADLYSSYVWRGTQFDAAPSIQPYVEFATGDLAVGVWGAYSTTTNAYSETDIYASYAIGDLSVGLTDYFFAGSYFEYEMNHILEANLGYAIGDLSLSANMNLLGDFQDNDMYFEVGYSLGAVDIFAGAGDGFYSTSGDFDLVNIGMSTSKEVKITDSFSLPVSASFIINPDQEQVFFLVGISL